MRVTSWARERPRGEDTQRGPTYLFVPVHVQHVDGSEDGALVEAPAQHQAQQRAEFGDGDGAAAIAVEGVEHLLQGTEEKGQGGRDDVCERERARGGG